MKYILGLKLGMSQIFDEKGIRVPVTLVETGPCYIVQIKTKEKDGYEAVQIGFRETKKLNKPEQGHSKPSGKNLYWLREIRLKSAKEAELLKVGEQIDVLTFKEGDKITIAGLTKGKGFAGAVKRWGFHGKPATHGTKHEGRTVGSVGSRYPQRVIKGKKMPGHLGAERVTFKNMKIVKIDKADNLLAVEGALPGRKGTLLEIRG